MRTRSSGQEERVSLSSSSPSRRVRTVAYATADNTGGSTYDACRWVVFVFVLADPGSRTCWVRTGRGCPRPRSPCPPSTLESHADESGQLGARVDQALRRGLPGAAVPGFQNCMVTAKMEAVPLWCRCWATARGGGGRGQNSRAHHFSPNIISLDSGLVCQLIPLGECSARTLLVLVIRSTSKL